MDPLKTKEELRLLIKEKAFIRKEVILSSGKKSDFYIDIRKISLDAKGNFLIANLMWEIIKNENVTAIGGPTIGADPIVSSVLYHAYTLSASIKGFLIRSNQKQHGMMNVIEGPGLSERDSVVLVDDVITTGGSLKAAIDVLEGAGIIVKKIVSVLDRGEEKKFDPQKYSFSSLFCLSDII